MNARQYFFNSIYHPHLLLIDALIILTITFISITGNWIFIVVIVLEALLKLFTSFRFSPILSSLEIDGQYVYLTYFGIKTKKLPLKQIFLYQRRYHGLDYMVFSPSALTIVTWRDIAKNRKAIVYPVCGNMKNDFSDLFKNVRY